MFSVAIFVFTVIFFLTTLACFWNLTNLTLTNKLGSNTDSVPAYLTDYGLYLRTSILSSDMENCINCGISTSRCNTTGRRPLDEESILAIVRAWVEPRIVDPSHHVCQACWDLAVDRLLLQEGQENSAPRGHTRVCIQCGRSLLRNVRSHRLQSNNDQERRILNVISEWILPRTIGALSEICHACWMRADRASRHFISQPSTSTSGMSTVNASPPIELANEPAINQPPSEISQDKIILPDYLRPVQTESRCFVEGCNRTERNRVPTSMRRNLLNLHNYYVPQNNRFCDYHLYAVETLHLLIGLSNNSVNTFTACHIQDMLALKSPTSELLNFEDIDGIEDHVFYYWVGFTKTQFRQILEEVPSLARMSRGVTALAAYLTKLRTGDSDVRLAALIKIPRSTLERLIKKAREMLTIHYVPYHLGLSHISREQLCSRTLAIPYGLFGNHNGENKAVVICDGTYIYVQKSTNYMYQKDTYSLHKYRNLVKPFLMVCTDGYIIDVLGPYPATTSDAVIMKQEFKDGSVMRDYFESNDAFVLDRGFRDALPFLNMSGYRTYVPESLERGESQLSTIKANKSRAVTICRWVVEVVNGRFKRDFKLLRQEFFNLASKHLMEDFKVAAALTNSFHPVLRDRHDAEEILEIINQNMHTENRLANYVIENNLNRRSANYTPVIVNNDVVIDFPQLTYDELILISLGTYQIKQARCYYGEHVRADGSYVIEVCREVDNDLIRELSISSSTWLLRGKIHSRHISRKIYYIYILIDSSLIGRQAILQYYCNCIVGRRTVGCCAHTMSIIWYLSWARHQENITPPAHFLDNILIVYEDE